jgi:small subunit ribosomal protein S3
MLNKYFVKQAIREVLIQNYIRNHFPSDDYSQIELQRTPLGIKIVIHTHKPGRVIGRSGSKINKMSDILKTKFQLDNPQIDVKAIDNPDLDAKIVSKQIKTALERGYNYKKIGNLAMKRVMDAGAVGVELVIAGKLGGSKGRTGKFISGYLKHCGDTAQKLVDYGFEEANTKPGKIGIKVKIMKEYMDITGELKKKDSAPNSYGRGRHERKFKEPQDAIGDEEAVLDFDYSENAPDSPAPTVPEAPVAGEAPVEQVDTAGKKPEKREKNKKEENKD